MKKKLGRVTVDEVADAPGKDEHDAHGDDHRDDHHDEMLRHPDRGDDRVEREDDVEREAGRRAALDEVVALPFSAMIGAMARFRGALELTHCLIAIAALACSGNDESDGDDLEDPGPSSGVDRSQTVVGLPDDGVLELCEWVAGRVGGWGRRIECSENGSVGSAAGPSECLESYRTINPSCQVTVGDLEDCVNDIVDGCTSLPPACEVILSCA